MFYESCRLIFFGIDATLQRSSLTTFSPTIMPPSTLQHRRTHNLLLVSKLLCLRDAASPFTLALDSLEQSAKPLITEYIRRAQVRTGPCRSKPSRHLMANNTSGCRHSDSLRLVRNTESASQGRCLHKRLETRPTCLAGRNRQCTQGATRETYDKSIAIVGPKQKTDDVIREAAHLRQSQCLDRDRACEPARSAVILHRTHNLALGGIPHGCPYKYHVTTRPLRAGSVGAAKVSRHDHLHAALSASCSGEEGPRPKSRRAIFWTG